MPLRSRRSRTLIIGACPCSTPIRRRPPPVRATDAPVPTATTAHLSGPQHEPRSRPAALLAAAHTLLPVLEAGRALDAHALREAMTQAFGATDARGAWVWKDAYEAAEVALVLFLQRYGRAMRREAGAGPGGPAAMLGMLETIAALEPSQTRRSEEQIALRQFSTPLPLAYAAIQAAAIRPGDAVLEPSAGTGMLAVMAAVRARQWLRRLPPPERDRRHPRRALVRPVPRRGRHSPQRRILARPPAGSPSHRGPDEPALLGKPRRGPHPQGRRSAPHPLGLLNAAAGRAFGGHRVRPLRSRRRRLEGCFRVARSAGPHRVHRRHRRTCLRAPRHHLRHQTHRARQGRGRTGPDRPPRPRRGCRPAARGRRRGARPSAHRAGAGRSESCRRSVRPCDGTPPGTAQKCRSDPFHAASTTT